MLWVLITGEYCSRGGGVSDYTRLLAEGLAGKGDQVFVWAPPGEALPLGNVELRRLPDWFGRKSRRVLDAAICRLPMDTRVLVQYVPQAFGWKGMNVHFVFWLWRRRRRHRIDVMFHEVATPWGDGIRLRQLRRHFLAAVTRVMAMFAAGAADQIYGSIPAWERMLHCLGVRRPFEWLPVPSTVPVEVDSGRVAKTREHLLRTCRTRFLVGHFGTFGAHIGTGLEVVLPRLLAAEATLSVVLIGRGSTEFAGAFRGGCPVVGDRLLGTGSLPINAVAEHLAACDVLLQPYLDGVTSRRTSVMAGLALGRPIVTTFGFLSEPIWRESGAVQLVNSVAEMPQAVCALLRDEAARERLGRAAAALYHDQFCIERTIETLRSRALERSSAA